MEMAKFGATPKGGVRRLALSDEEKLARDLFVQWCKDARCEVSVDQMGNIFARREGTDPDAMPVMAGSHLDSQPTGGKFDGPLGVLSALEVIETLNDNNITTNHPIEIVSWTNEEGARFPPGIIGSGIFSGTYNLEFGLACKDQNGLTIGDELKRIGYAGDVRCKPRPIKAFFEVHIEQGPTLEQENKSVGIVTDVQGLYWYKFSIEGKEAHAGSTPMDVRRDPVKAAVRLFDEIYELAENTPGLVVTFGDIQTPPNSINTIPGKLTTTLDTRHPDLETLTHINNAIRQYVDQVAQATGQQIETEQLAYAAPVRFNLECITSVRKAVEITGASSLDLVSGAGHDAMHIAKIAPASMIFVPCQDGLSHNEHESIEPEHAEAGANVLLHAVLDQAGG